MAEGIDSVVVTSQPYRSPDSLLESRVSEYGMCAFLCRLTGNLTFYSMGPDITELVHI